MMNALDEALGQIATFTGVHAGPVSRHRVLGERVATALGWKTGNSRTETLTLRTDGMNLVHGYIGPQRATLFATNGASATTHMLSEAARYAYHTSVHWGIVADTRGAVVFNSHWLRNGDWFRLPEIRWSDIERHRDILIAVTPSGIAAGSLDQIALETYKPDDFLVPVDDALVSRLDHWRVEALRFGRDVTDLDEDLHTLFAQLFVLRAVEDRGLAPDVPPLQSAIDGQKVSMERLDELFEIAAARIQSKLFSEDTISRFPNFVLMGIIRDLYTPSHLPKESARYNFGWVDADVLGRAYEKYLSTVYMPTLPSPQLRLFDQPEREVEPVSVKKYGGVYYTPPFLVSALTEGALANAIEASDAPEFIPRVADFACGSGSFLVEAVSSLLRRLRERDPDKNWPRILIEEKNIIGIDLDLRAVRHCRMNLWIRFTDEPDALPLPSIEEVIVQGDSLGEEVWQDLPRTYDVVLGNPPFVSTGGARSKEDLASRFGSAQGRFDYAHLFVELAIRRLAPNGTLGMVIPNRVFRNRDAGVIRGIVSSQTDILAIVDFGSNEVFEGTGAYIGAIVARKKAQSDIPAPPTTKAIIVSELSDTRFLGATLVDLMRLSGSEERAGVTAFEIRHPFGDRPWLLLSPAKLAARLQLEDEPVRLGDFAALHQGIRTGANDIFVVTIESSDGTLARIVNGLGDSAIIELALLRPVVFGSEIQRYLSLVSSRMLIYPYRMGAAIEESRLREEFPNGFQYLLGYREFLAGRSSTIRSGQRWYELAWKRHEGWLAVPKLLTRDLATRTSFAADLYGQIYLVGGTAVVPPDAEFALPLLGYLNSSTANGYLSDITPSFRGSFQKFEPQHLNRLPIPSFLVGADPVALTIGELTQKAMTAYTYGDFEKGRGIEEQIDALVADAVERKVRA